MLCGAAVVIQNCAALYARPEVHVKAPKNANLGRATLGRDTNDRDTDKQPDQKYLDRG